MASDAEEGGGLPKPPGRGRHLPRGSVLYSTIWSRFQKLRLLTFCFTQENTTVRSTITYYFQRIIDFSQEDRRQQVDLSKSEGSLFKTPKAVGARGLLPLPDFSFTERPLHTYPLLSAFPNTCFLTPGSSTKLVTK